MNRFLLDTVTVSASRRPLDNPQVVRWFQAERSSQFFVSALTLGELQQGVELARDSRSRHILQRWLVAVRALYQDRLIPFGPEEAVTWGTLYAPLQIAGNPPAVVDSMIGATAALHGLVVVTRDVSDFTPLGVEVVNPWDT